MIEKYLEARVHVILKDTSYIIQNDEYSFSVHDTLMPGVTHDPLIWNGLSYSEKNLLHVSLIFFYINICNILNMPADTKSKNVMKRKPYFHYNFIFTIGLYCAVITSRDLFFNISTK